MGEAMGGVLGDEGGRLPEPEPLPRPEPLLRTEVRVLLLRLLLRTGAERAAAERADVARRLLPRVALLAAPEAAGSTSGVIAGAAAAGLAAAAAAGLGEGVLAAGLADWGEEVVAMAGERGAGGAGFKACTDGAGVSRRAPRSR
jgi:hypothetical protein